MTRRMVRFTVTEELLVEALGMPEGTEIFNIRHTGHPYEFEFVVEHADLPEIDVGKPAPEIEPKITRMGDPPRRHWLQWDWNLPFFMQDLKDEEE